MWKQVIALGSLTATMLVAGCGSNAATPGPAPTSKPVPTAPAPAPAKVTVGVWGNRTEVAAWQAAVNDYNASTDLADVTVKSWTSDEAMIDELAKPGAVVPDVFLIGRPDLDALNARHQVKPVDAFLDARNVDIGDEYSRDALEAFSENHRLQCMPATVQPEVMFYNTDLVDFTRLQHLGVDVPKLEDLTSWTWDEFQLAAQSVIGHKGVMPFGLAPTIAGLAPFIGAAGGNVGSPDGTVLTMSSGNTVDALEEVLPVLTNPKLTKLASPALQLQLFLRGRLAMMVGDRSMVPALRAATDLRWDVLPIPKISGNATIGDFTALCLSADSQVIQDAADVLVGLSSVRGVDPMVKTGYVVPVNQQVALANTFLQPDQSPLHAIVFPNAVRNMAPLPLGRKLSDVEQAVATKVAELLIPGQLPVVIAQIAAAIDATANAIVSPSPSPSPN